MKNKDYKEKGLFAEMFIPHKNCPLLYLKKKYKDDLKANIMPSFSHNGKYIVNFSINTIKLDDFCNDVRMKKGIDIIDYNLSSGRSVVYCVITDIVFSILGEMNGGKTPAFLSEYDLIINPRSLNRFVEYFDVAIPDEDYYITTVVKKLNKQAVENKIDWRVREGLEKKLVPGLSLYQHYLVDQSLKADYFEALDKRKLKPLSEKLKVDIDTLKRQIDEVGGELCLKFINYFEKGV